jgi:hypothetical protein
MQYTYGVKNAYSQLENMNLGYVDGKVLLNHTSEHRMEEGCRLDLSVS